MADVPLVERVRIHLSRQAAWLEGLLAELEQCRFDDAAIDLESKMAGLDRRIGEREQWEEAHALLLGEWERNYAAISVADRTDIRAQSDAVRTLAARVGAAYQRVAADAEARKQRVGDSLAQLGRGRHFMERQYVESAESWFIDRKA